MKFVPRNATDEQILAVIHYWLDALAREEFALVFDEIGYAVAYQEELLGAEIIRNRIKAYRSSLFPGLTDFTVSDWRTAIGGNPNPYQRIIRYEPDDTGLRGAAELELPLNGKWSNLQADFVWFDNTNPHEGFTLSLEEIRSNEPLPDD